MAASGYTPISLYYSTTASAVPTSGNLVDGELAINTADMKLYAKNSAGTVTLLASSSGASGTVSSVSGTGTVSGITLSGTVTTSGSLTLGGTLDLSSPPAIGATTANTGAFTTLSASGAVTLSGGTANGVTYLNGSKVLTSGSALTFDGTNFATTGKVGAGTSSPTAKLQATASGSANLILENTTASTGKLWQLNSSSSGVLNFGVYGVDDYLFLTPAGLMGIGTSSPAGFLDIQGTQTYSLLMTRFGSSANTGLRRASGTQASPTIIANGDAIHQISFQGYDGVSAYQNAAQIKAVIDGATISATSMPGALYFGTTPSGSVTITERLRIASNGAWGLAGANYGTSGQVLTSNGSGSAPTWAAASGGASKGQAIVLSMVFGI